MSQFFFENKPAAISTYTTDQVFVSGTNVNLILSVWSVYGNTNVATISGRVSCGAPGINPDEAVFPPGAVSPTIPVGTFFRFPMTAQGGLTANGVLVITAPGQATIQVAHTAAGVYQFNLSLPR